MRLPPGPRAPAAVNLARFGIRPLETLRAWYARYGEVFTVSYPVFGTGVYVADPVAIRQLFTGDQSDLLAGEANSFMEPVLGRHSVLILDGPEHIRQRKLLLPPFQGSRVANFRAVIADVAEREVAGWRPGDRLVLRERMRALTFEVISRVVFGVTEPARVARLRAAMGTVIDSSRCTCSAAICVRTTGRSAPGDGSCGGCGWRTRCCWKRSRPGGASPTSRSDPTCSRCSCEPAMRPDKR